MLAMKRKLSEDPLQILYNGFKNRSTDDIMNVLPQINFEFYDPCEIINLRDLNINQTKEFITSLFKKINNIETLRKLNAFKTYSNYFKHTNLKIWFYMLCNEIFTDMSILDFDSLTIRSLNLLKIEDLKLTEDKIVKLFKDLLSLSSDRIDTLFEINTIKEEAFILFYKYVAKFPSLDIHLKIDTDIDFKEIIISNCNHKLYLISMFDFFAKYKLFTKKHIKQIICTCINNMYSYKYTLNTENIDVKFYIIFEDIKKYKTVIDQLNINFNTLDFKINVPMILNNSVQFSKIDKPYPFSNKKAPLFLNDDRLAKILSFLTSYNYKFPNLNTYNRTHVIYLLFLNLFKNDYNENTPVNTTVWFTNNFLFSVKCDIHSCDCNIPCCRNKCKHVLKKEHDAINEQYDIIEECINYIVNANCEEFLISTVYKYIQCYLNNTGTEEYKTKGKIEHIRYTKYIEMLNYIKSQLNDLRAKCIQLTNLEKN